MPASPPPTIRQVPPGEAQALVQGSNALIVDVRETYEWESARIPGAVHLPLGDLEKRADDLPRDRPLILQCHVGQRSLVAARFLASKGFPDVANLAGGILAWANAGLPLVR